MFLWSYPVRQQVILHAVFDESGEFGLMSLYVKQVARRAGICVGSLFPYFEYREALMDLQSCIVLATWLINSEVTSHSSQR
jgi:DNA-binding transcriptional regulator YbjK